MNYAPGTWRPEFDGDFELRHRPGPQSQRYRPEPQRRYGIRKCRICLEEVAPIWDDPSLRPGMLTSKKPKYISPDPELGRLMSPCMCKGSQKYVHEGCLDAWRHAARNHSSRHMWKCPTCGFQYRTSRLSVGKALSHWATNAGLTIIAVLSAIFVLGFVADNIIDLYLDPWGFFFYGPPQPRTRTYYGRTAEEIAMEQAWEKLEASWVFHFFKGFFSLGVIGFVKTMLASPFFFFSTGGRRRRGNGRDRYNDMSLVLVLIGAATFIFVSHTLYFGLLFELISS